MNYGETYFELDSEEVTVCTYCSSGFFLLMCVQWYKQNRYRDTEIKGYVKGVESSSIYTIRAVLLYMSEVSKVHTGLSIQSYVIHVKSVKSSSIYTIRAVKPCMSKVLNKAQNGLEHFLLITFLIFNRSNAHQMLCMSKHVGGVKGQNNLWHLQHREHLMVEKP